MIGASKTWNLLVQEAFMTKSAILSAFDQLLKANVHASRDGMFYSAFFQLTIGMERIMKLLVVTDFMLENDYKTPDKKLLQHELSHDLTKAYQYCLKIIPKYRISKFYHAQEGSLDLKLMNFLSKFAKSTRYYNFDQLSNSTAQQSPLDEWRTLCREIYSESVSGEAMEKASLKLMYSLDQDGFGNPFTRILDIDGGPMTRFDVLHEQLMVRKAAPLVIWKVIQMFRPMHSALGEMSDLAQEYEAIKNMKNMVIPDYKDFFFFFYAMRSATMRRKTWTPLFQ